MKKILFPLLLVLSVVIMCLPRFDRQDMGLVSRFTNKSGWNGITETDDERTFPPDVQYYIAYVHLFRGESAKVKLAPPFSYRPMTPFLASLLPFRPLTAINITNIFFLSAGIIFLFQTLKFLGYSEKKSFIGGLMFSISFPVFYYSSTGYIDASMIGVLCAAVYFFLRKNWLGFFLSVIIGALIKETMIVIFPAAFFFCWRMHDKRMFSTVTAAFLIFVLTSFFIRKFAPGDAGYGWFASGKIFFENALRPRTYLSFLLSLGLVGILALLRIMRGKISSIPFAEFFLAGFATAVALFGYAMLSAYADGRFIWTAYPFLIPIAVDLIQSWRKNSSGENFLQTKISRPSKEKLNV